MNFRRFTIRGGMVAVAVVGAVLAILMRYPYQGLLGVYTLTPAAMAWLAGRGRPSLARWAFFGSAAWLDASMFFLVLYAPAFNDDMLWFAASLVFVPIAPGFGLAWLSTREGRARKARAAVLVIAATAFPISIMTTWWPLELGFYLSSPALNRLADRVDRGGKVVPGEWAGIYRIRGATPIRYNGSTLLLIDDDPRGIAGFARKKGAALGVADREWVDVGQGVIDRWSYLAED